MNKLVPFGANDQLILFHCEASDKDLPASWLIQYLVLSLFCCCFVLKTHTHVHVRLVSGNSTVPPQQWKPARVDILRENNYFSTIVKGGKCVRRRY